MELSLGEGPVLSSGVVAEKSQGHSSTAGGVAGDEWCQRSGLKQTLFGAAPQKKAAARQPGREDDGWTDGGAEATD